MAKYRHLSPHEETEHDTVVFMHGVIYTGIAFLLFFAAAFLIVYGTNGKIIPGSTPAHPTSQMISPVPIGTAGPSLC